MAGNLPTYNLKAVIHETGLTPATLRAWERRYGLLKPQRSPGGQRLYTQADIEMLKWLVVRQSEGLSISHAIEMWRSLGKSAAAQARADLVQVSAAGAGENMLDQLRSNWLAACLAFDETGAELALAQALAMAAPEVVCTELLQKGLAMIGEGWYTGTVSVQQEHFASALAMRRLNALFAVAPAPTRPGRLLAACPSGEAHDLSLLMLAFILRWRGWEVVYLGANVPLTRLDATLQSTAPHLVLSVAQTLPGAAALSELANYVKKQSIALGYGGGIFNHIPALTERIPAYFLGHDLSSVPQVVEGLLTHRPALPTPQPISTSYVAALAGFIEKEALIVMSVDAALHDGPIAPRHLEEANLHLTRAIASALNLGDIRFLDYSVGWLSGLLVNYGLSPSLTAHYYSAYRQAVQQHLGSQGELILDWLAKIELTV
jgi:MerR family transcriptional regulator, light-induced transcriptional regulator